VTVLLLGAIQERDAVRRKDSVNESLNKCTKIKTEHRNPGKVMHCTNKTKGNETWK
jgi:hypothetical protein